MNPTVHIALTQNAPASICSIFRFEELFQIRYFPHLLFADWKVEQWVRHKCAQAYKRGRVGELALWLGKLHGKQIDEGGVPALTIRWMGEQIGYGAYANKLFEKWEYIGEYTGLLRKRGLLFRNLNDYCFMYPQMWFSLNPLTIDANQQGNLT
ncbi:MAG: SET domain-containing protein-lysine N-methyltransferase, partial [Chlamydiia bacterium]|nr:SET domain-containing protein-lysine N-methyltransferase [Chlamydiia bacterium]